MLFTRRGQQGFGRGRPAERRGGGGGLLIGECRCWRFRSISVCVYRQIYDNDRSYSYATGVCVCVEREGGGGGGLAGKDRGLEVS